MNCYVSVSRLVLVSTMPLDSLLVATCPTPLTVFRNCSINSMYPLYDTDTCSSASRSSTRWLRGWCRPYQQTIPADPQKPDCLVRAKNTPGYSTSNPNDSYTKDNNKCFNIQHCHTEQYKKNHSLRKHRWTGVILTTPQFIPSL